MKRLITIFFMYLLTLHLTTFAQIKSTLSGSHISLNIDLDSIRKIDTLVFTFDKKGSLYFKENGKLREEQWYAECGNKYFLDFFIPKPPKWLTVGFWNISNENTKTALTFNIDKIRYKLLVVSSCESNIKFTIENVTDFRIKYNYNDKIVNVYNEHQATILKIYDIFDNIIKMKKLDIGINSIDIGDLKDARTIKLFEGKKKKQELFI